MRSLKPVVTYSLVKTEFDVLQVLWQYGPSTARFIHDRLLRQKREVAYTSTLKLMQVMHEKGILNRNESQMRHLYTTVRPERELTQTVLNWFIDSIFKGAPNSLVVASPGNDDTSAEELNKMRELFRNIEEK